MCCYLQERRFSSRLYPEPTLYLQVVFNSEKNGRGFTLVKQIGVERFGAKCQRLAFFLNKKNWHDPGAVTFFWIFFKKERSIASQLLNKEHTNNIYIFSTENYTKHSYQAGVRVWTGEWDCSSSNFYLPKAAN